LAALCAGLLAGAGAWAAGGHHGVDDAAILEPGACELESWFTGARGGERLLHAGAGCRVGPVELGLASEYARQGGASQANHGLQAKWAQAVAEGLSVGASFGPAWQAHAAPRYQGISFAALATWAPRDDLALHLNLGRDLVHGGRDLARHGVAAEWRPHQRWSFVAERYLEERAHFVRAGARWSIGEGWSLDLSRAHRLSGPGASAWTLGVSWVLDRD
jgi:hypothetical protein